MSDQQLQQIKWYQRVGFYLAWGSYLLALSFVAGVFARAVVRLFNMGWNLW